MPDDNTIVASLISSTNSPIPSFASLCSSYKSTRKEDEETASERAFEGTQIDLRTRVRTQEEHRSRWYVAHPTRGCLRTQSEATISSLLEERELLYRATWWVVVEFHPIILYLHQVRAIHSCERWEGKNIPILFSGFCEAKASLLLHKNHWKGSECSYQWAVSWTEIPRAKISSVGFGLEEDLRDSIGTEGMGSALGSENCKSGRIWEIKAARDSIDLSHQYGTLIRVTPMYIKVSKGKNLGYDLIFLSYSYPFSSVLTRFHKCLCWNNAFLLGIRKLNPAQGERHRIVEVDSCLGEDNSIEVLHEERELEEPFAK